MPQAHFDALAANPEMLEGFLGAEPEIEGRDALAFEHFWRCRRATPSDQPLDPVKALALYERLYGTVDAFALLDALSVMDAEFAKHVAKEQEQQIEKSKKGDR